MVDNNTVVEASIHFIFIRNIGKTRVFITFLITVFVYPGYSKTKVWYKILGWFPV